MTYYFILKLTPPLRQLLVGLWVVFFSPIIVGTWGWGGGGGNWLYISVL